VFLQKMKPYLQVDPQDGTERKISLIDRLFNIRTEVTYKNREVPEEPEQVRHEDILKLSAHIEGGPEVSEMLAGIKVSFTGEVEKRSETLQRDCIYNKKTEIAALPSYICVNFVRFYWKKESTVSGTKAGKAKILKAVSFPKVFDAYPLCTRDLQKQLDLGREFERREREAETFAANTAVDDAMKAKEEEKKSSKMEIDGEEHKRSTAHGRAMEERKQKLEQIKRQDIQLYREHGVGLDTGNY